MNGEALDNIEGSGIIERSAASLGEDRREQWES